MIERGGRPGFPLKTFASLWILRQFFRKELQGHAAAEALVFRLVNHAHSAAAQFFDDAVMGNCLAQHVATMLGRGWGQVNLGSGTCKL